MLPFLLFVVYLCEKKEYEEDIVIDVGIAVLFDEWCFGRGR